LDAGGFGSTVEPSWGKYRIFRLPEAVAVLLSSDIRRKILLRFSAFYD